MADPRQGKAIKAGSFSTTTIFENFDSLLLIDVGEADGFTLVDENGGECPVPSSATPLSISKPGSPSRYLKVKATGATALNASYLMYQ